MTQTLKTARGRADERRKAAIEAYEAGYRAWPETSAKFGAEHTSMVLRNLAEAMVEAIQFDVQAEMLEAKAAKAWADLQAAWDAKRAVRYQLTQAGTAFPDARRGLEAALVAAEAEVVAANARLDVVYRGEEYPQ